MEMQPVDHLLAAVLEGDADRVAELVAVRPELRAARNMFGVTALHAAHFTGQPDLAATLVPDGGVDLFLAAALGRLDDLDRELAEQADPQAFVREHDDAGGTALHAACYWGQVGAAWRLLEAGAAPTVATRDQFLRISPLGSAIATTPGVPQPSDDEDVVLALVRLLLEHGAEVTPAGPTARRRSTPPRGVGSAGWCRSCSTPAPIPRSPAGRVTTRARPRPTPPWPRATWCWPAASTPASPRWPTPTPDPLAIATPRPPCGQLVTFVWADPRPCRTQPGLAGGDDVAVVMRPRGCQAPTASRARHRGHRRSPCTDPRSTAATCSSR
jgi:hypothetical protein